MQKSGLLRPFFCMCFGRSKVCEMLLTRTLNNMTLYDGVSKNLYAFSQSTPRTTKLLQIYVSRYGATRSLQLFTSLELADSIQWSFWCTSRTVFRYNSRCACPSCGKEDGLAHWNPPDETTRLEPKLRLLVEIVEKGMPEKVKTEMLLSLQNVDSWHRPEGNSMEEMRELWKTLLYEHRILCLTESTVHTAMW